MNFWMKAISMNMKAMPTAVKYPTNRHCMPLATAASPRRNDNGSSTSRKLANSASSSVAINTR